MFDKAEKGIFVGYADDAKTYKILLPLNHQVVVSRSVVFLEDDRFTAAGVNQPPKQTLVLGDDMTSDQFELEASALHKVPPCVSSLRTTPEMFIIEGEALPYITKTETEVLEYDDNAIDLEVGQHETEAETKRQMERDQTPPHTNEINEKSWFCVERALIQSKWPEQQVQSHCKTNECEFSVGKPKGKERWFDRCRVELT